MQKSTIFARILIFALAYSSLAAVTRGDEKPTGVGTVAELFNSLTHQGITPTSLSYKHEQNLLLGRHRVEAVLAIITGLIFDLTGAPLLDLLLEDRA